MTCNTQPEALRLADDLETSSLFPGNMRCCNDAAAELRRLHAENERLSGLCDKWNSECDEFREDNKRLAAALVEAQQHTRIAELEAEMEAVGAGGVQALSAAPAGWKLVPVEPTGVMLTAAEIAIAGAGKTLGRYNAYAAAYSALLAASPTPPAEQAAPKAAPVKACVCGEPQASGTVHRVDGPCYVAAPQPAPAPLSEQDEREAFEAWAIKEYAGSPVASAKDGTGYRYSSIHESWMAWQARAALAAQGGTP